MGSESSTASIDEVPQDEGSDASVEATGTEVDKTEFPDSGGGALPRRDDPREPGWNGSSRHLAGTGQAVTWLERVKQDNLKREAEKREQDALHKAAPYELRGRHVCLV